MSESEKTFEQTPTWVLAIVFLVFIVLSTAFGTCIKKLEHFFKMKGLLGMEKALHKMIEEVMLLGFISLVLIALQHQILKICVGIRGDTRWTPCFAQVHASNDTMTEDDSHATNPHTTTNETLTEEALPHRLRMLLGEAVSGGVTTVSSTGMCGAGQEPAISKHALEQVHILLFLVAIFHIVYCTFTLTLSVFTVGHWRKFEDGVRQKNELKINEEKGETVLTVIFRQLSRTRSVAAQELDNHSAIAQWFVLFFSPLHAAQYEHLRFKFIYIHKVHSSYNFSRYVMLSLQDEFSHLVGLDGSIWCIVLFYVLFDIPASYVRYWLPNLVVIFVLLLNWKVRTILTDVLHEPISEGEDRHMILERRTQMYWFKRPAAMRILLKLMLFQVSFEPGLTVFRIWQLGMDSCYLDLTASNVGNILLILVHFAVSMFLSLYIGLRFIPFYVLALQMGSNFNRNIFSSSIAEQLVKWKKFGAKAASKKAAKGNLAKRPLRGLADQSAYHTEALFADHKPKSPKHVANKAGAKLLNSLPQLLQQGKKEAANGMPGTPDEGMNSVPGVYDSPMRGSSVELNGSMGLLAKDAAPDAMNGHHVGPPKGAEGASPGNVRGSPEPSDPQDLAEGSPLQLPGRVPGNYSPRTPPKSPRVDAQAPPQEAPEYTAITVDVPRT